ncbi:hypothetical protein DM684_11630 [Salmonella bongori]|nr:hypothetical protein [Salmonella bongori]ECE6548823.1 hypothetical protein [Salmonella bongori]ECI3518716.1 hypothetical protein [Salmonella bongori]
MESLMREKNVHLAKKGEAGKESDSPPAYCSLSPYKRKEIVGLAPKFIGWSIHRKRTARSSRRLIHLRQ